MNWLESLILGVLQGLTEFLPVSSSGHLELAKSLLDIEVEESLTFTVAVHGATVLSIIVVFWKDLLYLVKDLFQFRYNESTQFILKILVSMVPVLLLGLFMKQEVEQLFSGRVRMVGAMLLVTAVLLTIAHYAKVVHKRISYRNAFIIGLAQALAVIPGISRSGATIATGLILRNEREEVARFSFLMVLLPIIGANILDIYSATGSYGEGIGVPSILIGFVSAFIVGVLACRWMINMVKRGKLIYFAIYCIAIGFIALILG
jgi:undecaprenyl-diphosphatase